MQWKAVIVLAALVAGILMPPSLPMLAVHGTAASIGTLDVCHSAAPALSTQGDMPFVTVHALPCMTPSLLGNVLAEQSPFLPFVIASLVEHPPKQ